MIDRHPTPKPYALPTKQQIRQTAASMPNANYEKVARALGCRAADIREILGDKQYYDEQADFDQAYSTTKPQPLDDKPGTGEFSDRGRADLKVRPNDPRFADNPMADIQLDEFAGGSEIDRLHQMLTNADVSDQQIKGGVSLTQAGKMKVAARLGIGPQDVDMYLNVITQQLRDQENDETDNVLSEAYYNAVNAIDEEFEAPDASDNEPDEKEDAWGKNKFKKKDAAVEEDSDALAKWRAEHQKKTAPKEKTAPVKEAGRKPSRPFDLSEERYSYEADALGSVTVRDLTTGRSKFVQGATAARLLARLKNKSANQDMILAPLIEAMDDTPPVSDFWDEIEAKSGSYNFQWKLPDQHGTGTVLFQADGTPALRLVAVRDTDGNKIAADHTMRQELLQQARDFIGQE